MAHLQKTVDARAVICSIDVGNSTSSVSFLYAKRGDQFKDLKNKVYRADTWPKHTKKNVLIPSQLCYLDRKPYRYGENATDPGEEDKWVFVESFKRHVNSLGSNDVSALDRGDFPPFPQGVTLRDIYRDWVSFLFSAASEAFRRSSKGADIGPDLWRNRVCVFVVPNGWNEPEQAHLCEVLHQAKCVEDSANIRFARESEADLHYGLFLGFEKLTRPLNLSFFICNVGTSTGDLGFYKVTNTNPLHYAEVKSAESFPAGIIVDKEVAAETNCEDPAPGNEEIKDPVYYVLKYVDKFRKVAPSDVAPKYIVLAGGCGRDRVSREHISNALNPDITVLSLSDAGNADSRSPAQICGYPTVDGALYSCIHNFITARMAPYHYGCVASIPFNQNIQEHRRRSVHGIRWIAGKSFLPNAWQKIVDLGELIRDGDGRKKDFTIHFRERPSGRHPTTVTLYATKKPNPEWVFQSHGKSLAGGVREICKIIADIDTDEIQVEEKELANGQKSFKATYTLDIDFGSVTSSVTVSWRRKNKMIDSTMATFSPPNDTESDWNTNEHQGDTAHDNNSDDKGQDSTPQSNLGTKEENPPPPPYDADVKAVLSTGIYYVINPNNSRGLGCACWDSGIIKEIQCRKDTRGNETEWYLDFASGSDTFTLGPHLGSPDDWRDKGSPLTGYSRDPPSASDQVLAWQTANSSVVKTWHAIRAAGGDHYRIVSNQGRFAWTIASEPKVNHNYLGIHLQPVDSNDMNQVWKLVRK